MPEPVSLTTDPEIPMRIEYEIHLRTECEHSQNHAVDVREDHVLPCGEIESEYVEGHIFRNREDAEAKWIALGKTYRDKLQRGNGGIIDHQNWIDGTSRITEVMPEP